MGATHGDADTYPRLGDVIGFVTPDQVIAIATAVVTAQRDHGNRVVRKRARLKYTIDDHGRLVQSEIETPRRVLPCSGAAVRFVTNGDRFGWVEGHDDAGISPCAFPGDVSSMAQARPAKTLQHLRGLARLRASCMQIHNRTVHPATAMRISA